MNAADRAKGYKLEHELTALERALFEVDQNRTWSAPADVRAAIRAGLVEQKDTWVYSVTPAGYAMLVAIGFDCVAWAERSARGGRRRAFARRLGGRLG